MKIIYESGVDVLRIILNDSPIEQSDEERPGVILDYDESGDIVAIEILQASQRVSDPRAIEYSAAA